MRYTPTSSKNHPPRLPQNRDPRLLKNNLWDRVWAPGKTPPIAYQKHKWPKMRQTYGQIDRQTDKMTDGQADGQTDIQTDRQIEMHPYTTHFLSHIEGTDTGVTFILL